MKSSSRSARMDTSKLKPRITFIRRQVSCPVDSADRSGRNVKDFLKEKEIEEFLKD